MKYLGLIIMCFLSASIISLIGVFILLSLNLIGNADSDFRNLPYGIAIGVNFCLGLGTFPIFLNLNDRVRSNLMWSALSFSFLPVVFVFFTLLAMWDQPWPGILFCMPYLVILVILFLRYRKHIKADDSRI